MWISEVGNFSGHEIRFQNSFFILLEKESFFKIFFQKKRKDSFFKNLFSKKEKRFFFQNLISKKEKRSFFEILFLKKEKRFFFQKSFFEKRKELQKNLFSNQKFKTFATKLEKYIYFKKTLKLYNLIQNRFDISHF